MHSEAIREPFSASLPLPPRSYALSSALHRHPTSPFFVTHGRSSSSPSLPLRFCLPFSLALHTHTHKHTHRHTRAQVALSFPLEIFSLSVRNARRFFASHSVPSKPLLALLCQSSYTRRTHEHRLSLSPSPISVGSFSISFFTLLRLLPIYPSRSDVFSLPPGPSFTPLYAPSTFRLRLRCPRPATTTSCPTSPFSTPLSSVGPASPSRSRE